jgi:hypothetical protein
VTAVGLTDEPSILVVEGLTVEPIIMPTVGLIVGSFIGPHTSIGTLKHALPVGHPSPEGQRIDKSKQFAWASNESTPQTFGTVVGEYDGAYVGQRSTGMGKHACVSFAQFPSMHSGLERQFVNASS